MKAIYFNLDKNQITARFRQKCYTIHMHIFHSCIYIPQLDIDSFFHNCKVALQLAVILI